MILLNTRFLILLNTEAGNAGLFRNLIDIDADTFISMIPFLVNFIVLALILSRLLYRPVRDFMHSRTERVLNQINQAKNDMEKAGELKLQYEQQLKSIEAERDGIIDEARKNAAETGKQIVADAKSEADDLLTRAKANIKLEVERAQEEMRQQIIEVSAVMSERFIKRAIDANDHERLFDETMAELEEMAWRS
jgi:F-type H+-transporting ATPase subunit b